MPWYCQLKNIDYPMCLSTFVLKEKIIVSQQQGYIFIRKYIHFPHRRQYLSSSPNRPYNPSFYWNWGDGILSQHWNCSRRKYNIGIYCQKFRSTYPNRCGIFWQPQLSNHKQYWVSSIFLLCGQKVTDIWQDWCWRGWWKTCRSHHRSTNDSRYIYSWCPSHSSHQPMGWCPKFSSS